MQAIGNILSRTTGSQQILGSVAWPVHRGSTRAEIHWHPLARLDASRRWHLLRAHDRATHSKGMHGGVLGRVGLAVYHALALDVLNHATGRCDPSLELIARRAGCSRRAVVDALATLRAIGAVTWQRRCAVERALDGRWRLRQKTNAYNLPAPAAWRIPCAHPGQATPAPGTWGDHPPLPDEIETAATAIASGDRAEAVRALGLAPPGSLAEALARLGQAIDASASTALNPDRDRVVDGGKKPPD